MLTFSPTTGPRQLEFKPSELTGEGGGVAMTTGAAAIAAASSHCHPIGRFIVTQHRVVFGATRWPKKHRLSLNYPWFRDFVVMIIFFSSFSLVVVTWIDEPCSVCHPLNPLKSGWLLQRVQISVRILDGFQTIRQGFRCDSVTMAPPPISAGGWRGGQGVGRGVGWDAQGIL